MNQITGVIIVAAVLFLSLGLQIYLYKNNKLTITRFTVPFAILGLILAPIMIYWAFTENNWPLLMAPAYIITNSLFKLYAAWKLKDIHANS